jgi:hypothetical protein
MSDSSQQDPQQGRDAPSGGDKTIAGNITDSTGVAVGTGARSIVNSYNTYYSEPPSWTLTPEERRNRADMLTLVESIWVKGLLERSLSEETCIALDLEGRPEAVDLPLNAIVQELNRPPEVLPHGTSITTVFDQVGGSLLILGAPGAGKTTLLLELARDLIRHARSDDHHRIPVVFNLSTWATERKPLKEWMVEQLSLVYQVPRKLGTRWVEGGRLLPLLDGLDEVAAEHRNACVEAINAFRLRDAEGMVPLVVCSRILDYQALGGKFQFQGAVRVRPLERQQVEEYLDRLGEALDGVRTLLREDSSLWELLDTPLMLAVVVLTYKDRPVEELRRMGGVQSLWDAYIERMFARRGTDTRWSREQMMHLLPWLAWQMQRHQQTVYYIEGMQPEWLPRGQQRLPKQGAASVLGLILGIGIGLAVAFSYGSGLGLGLGLALALTCWSYGRGEKIDVTETLRWALPRIGIWQATLSGTSLCMFIYGALGLLAYGAHGGLAGTVGGAAVGLVCGAVLAGIDSRELAAKITPNQGIHNSAHNALVSGLSAGLVIGVASALVFGLMFQLVFGVTSGVVFGLVGGLIFALMFGLSFGGDAIIQHYTLRFLLARDGKLPLHDRHLIGLLDYAAERILLRRVGGGWIFIHRLLLEHLADQYAAEQHTHSATPQSTPEPKS